MTQETQNDKTIEAFALVEQIVKDTGLSASRAVLRTLVEAFAQDLDAASRRSGGLKE